MHLFGSFLWKIKKILKLTSFGAKMGLFSKCMVWQCRTPIFLKDLLKENAPKQPKFLKVCKSILRHIIIAIFYYFELKTLFCGYLEPYDRIRAATRYTAIWRFFHQNMPHFAIFCCVSFKKTAVLRDFSLFHCLVGANHVWGENLRETA